MEALAKIDVMEAAVAYRTVTTDFTLTDVVRWLWPASVVDTLTAAYDVARGHQMLVDEGPISGHCLGVPMSCSFRIMLDQVRMLSPAPGLSNPQLAQHTPMAAALLALDDIYRAYNKVRRVVTWMNEHATPGAARFYFPALGALLPAHHAFYRADGLRYKEPSGDMTEVANVIREAASIVAAGVLADPEHVENPHTGWGVVIHSGFEGDENSQRFMLI